MARSRIALKKAGPSCPLVIRSQYARATAVGVLSRIGLTRPPAICHAVQKTPVEFFSGGERISALWRTPEDAAEPLRAIVQGPGWLGLKDAGLYVRYHEALVEGGFGVLVIDYRGFGDSGGARELSPRRQ